jgi:hypothetical protein
MIVGDEVKKEKSFFFRSPSLAALLVYCEQVLINNFPANGEVYLNIISNLIIYTNLLYNTAAIQ